MEKQLDNLRNSLNETLLKEAEFNTQSKQAVLDALKKRSKHIRPHYFKQTMSVVFTATLLAAVLLFAFTKFSIKDNMALQPVGHSGETSTKPKVAVQKKNDSTEQTEENVIDDRSNSALDLNKKDIAYPSQYIVLNGYYYKKTGKTVKKEELSEKVGEVKRIGDWKIVRDGDSNELPPGPLYSVKGYKADEYIAGRGVVYEDGVNKAAYLLFQKNIPVQKTDTSKIFNAKNDSEEVAIALNNVREAAGDFYELDQDLGTPTLISYSDEKGKAVQLYYKLPRKNDEFVFVTEFDNHLANKEYVSSRFARNDEKNKLEPLNEEFLLNDVKWIKYQDNKQGDTFYAGYGPQWNLEVSFQGEFDQKRTLELLKGLK